MVDQFIERKIIIGLITSTEFISEIRDVFHLKLLSSVMAKRLAGWCLEYYDKFGKAPSKDIEGIYYNKLNHGLSKEVGKDIEEVLSELNDDYVQSSEDIAVLIVQAKEYFQEKGLKEHTDKISTLLEQGEIEEASTIASNFKSVIVSENTTIDLSNAESLIKVDLAFKETKEPLIYYPKQLGVFWNDQFIRGNFVALMGSEKRGKTFWLMDMAMRAARQGRQVAFFQAGDMTESQQLRRMAIHLTKTSDMEQYCGVMYEPIPDCVYNQMDRCDRKERECDFGIFPDKSLVELRDSITFEELKEVYEDNPEYKSCYNCPEYQRNAWGTPWLRKIEVKTPLDAKKARETIEKFFVKSNRKLILSSHPNNSLTISKIRSMLYSWKKRYNFIPELVIIDYADLLVPERRSEFRHQQNEIWMGLRSLSQEDYDGIQPLVITATQADTDSYTKSLLSLKNFSEDKRKYAHVVAMYGLNQDPLGREKKIGIMRINEMVKREGDFNNKNVIHVLQNLRRGQPFIGCYL